MNDSLFDRIEKKTNVDKDTLLALAHKLQTGNYKDENTLSALGVTKETLLDENTLKEIIHELSSITGRSVSEEKENKIINMIINDKVPKDLEKYV